MECKAIPSIKLKEAFETLADLEFKVEKIFGDDEKAEASHLEKNKHEEDDEDSMDIDQIMENCQEPLNMANTNEEKINEQYFKLQQKEHSKLFTFKSKHVQAFFNIVSNFISHQLPHTDPHQRKHDQTHFTAQILAPYAFLNCQYQQSMVLYRGTTPKPSMKGQQSMSKYELKAFGVFFKQQVSQVVRIVHRAMALQSDKKDL